MPGFAAAAAQADATGSPVPEAFAVRLADGTDPGTAAPPVERALNRALPGFRWQAGPAAGGWLVCRARTSAPPPSLGEAWDAVRTLKGLPEVADAEPLLLTRVPVTSGSEAQRRFKLWGKASEARLKQIREASSENHKHWSLQQMGVCDAAGQNGAWAAWKTKRPGGTPGEGVVIAHPDTGYTLHPRLRDHLLPHPDNPNRFGRNFVERRNPDGLDPMQDRTLGNFPGHGTHTASVIATGDGPADAPWGVAPGARILPLRVSSSVIHISFENLCDAFLEAMDQGAHVISMSLGGPFGSGLLEALVLQALDRGIIIVAAAGNNVPTTGFPARIPGVIACAASNALRKPWRFSGLGFEVAITAPGELVWHDQARIDATGAVQFDRTNGSGTSYATASVAGLAALWLSYHGRDKILEHYENDASLLPFAFRLCLQRSADRTPEFVRGGRGGFGAGIAQADRLLAQALPDTAAATRERREVLARDAGGMAGFPLNTWWLILNLPTLAAAGGTAADQADGATAEPVDPTGPEAKARRGRIETFLGELVGPGCDEEDLREVGILGSTDPRLGGVLERVGRDERGRPSSDAVRRYLLDSGRPLSGTLRGKLERIRESRRQAWRDEARVSMTPFPMPDPRARSTVRSGRVSVPTVRRLRAFAFDPSLATRTDTAAINQITIPVVFERKLGPGPVGEYLEVVDVDPASDCAYAPVDLNHPYLLMQDGLAPSDGNPQFHQQMVYAVAMKTIAHFEESLGRPIFWSPLRPWHTASGDADRAEEREANGERVLRDQFVRRLRLYPHAMRAENAFYSPQKRAVLFGYFPAGDGNPASELPGGLVFTCLSHDIIAHEMTHAILDGMHVYFTEPTNPDVYAFHEAFADIVALFQHFTYPELLRDQISRARGDLGTGTLLTQLAMQFGQATGQHHALRDALGALVLQGRTRGPSEWRDRREEQEYQSTGGPEVTIRDAARSLDPEESRRVWKRYAADPALLGQIEEPHARGSLLVAAVFDAYLSIYEGRIADLKRIATGGTGVLPDGHLHPDLVNRMANEAAKAAGHVLRMCIRAMDYVPPIDITFGEFLRALITADYDLTPEDPRRYRVAFIEAFRKWGIYPRDVRTLSEESLRWSSPDKDVYLFPEFEDNRESRGDTAETKKMKRLSRLARLMRRALLAWEPGGERENVFDHILNAQAALNQYLWFMKEDTEEQRKLADAILKGLELPGRQDGGRPPNRFSVANLRPARRIGPNGEFLTEMVFEIVQTRSSAEGEDETPGDPRLPFRGGVTLVVSMDDWRVRYAIRKSLDSARRETRQREYELRAAGGGHGAAEYSAQAPPDLADRGAWFDARIQEREAMRISSCACRNDQRAAAAKKRAEKEAKKRGSLPAPAGPAEPFALLHQR